LSGPSQALINEHLRAYSAFLATQGAMVTEELVRLFSEATREDSVVLPRNEGLSCQYFDGGSHRSFIAKDEAQWYGVYLQAPHVPREGERAGVWYGQERRIDDLGRTWERRINAVVDDFGDLVEVPL
jgi:hypothetical protein